MNRISVSPDCRWMLLNDIVLKVMLIWKCFNSSFVSLNWSLFIGAFSKVHKKERCREREREMGVILALVNNKWDANLNENYQSWMRRMRSMLMGEPRWSQPAPGNGRTRLREKHSTNWILFWYMAPAKYHNVNIYIYIHLYSKRIIISFSFGLFYCQTQSKISGF